jgi:hypothetical protein
VCEAFHVQCCSRNPPRSVLPTALWAFVGWRQRPAGRIPLNGTAPELEQTAVLLAVEPQRVRVYRRQGEELGRGRLKAE